METAPAPYQALLEKINLPLSHIAAIYLRGSRGVGVGTETSDYDYVVITLDDVCIDEMRVNEGLIDFTLKDLKTFRKKVATNDIGTMECIFSPPVFLNIEDPTKTFVVDQWGLLTSTIRVARARRRRSKLTGQAKHLFIATRYLTYGLEILETGRIKDIKCMNYLWYENNEENQLMEKTFKDLMHKAKAAFDELIKSRQVNYGQEEDIADSSSFLEVVHYLRSFGLKKLCREKQIEFQRHPEHPNLIQFYYQICAETSGIVRECRGIILDESKNWSVVAYPFKRFDLEYKASQVKSIPDYESYDVYKKYDGSLCILYWYGEQWHVASSHTPDGSARLCKRAKDEEGSLSCLFWKIFAARNFERVFDKDFTYMFELTIKDHVVVTEEETCLVFLGKRNIKTLKEIPIRDCEESWDKPEKMVIGENELLEMIKTVDPRKIEGVILHNPQTNFRIKLKAEGYHKLANLYPICPSIKIASSTKFLLERHKLPDFLVRCPEHKYSLALFEKKKQALLEKAALAYETVPQSEWNHHKFKKMLFDKRNGKDFHISFDEHRIKYKLDLFSQVE